MSSSIYFAVASTLASVNPDSPLVTMVLNGQFREASVAAAVRAEPAQPGFAPDYASLQTYADMLLVLGQYEEAEDVYRRAQKAIRGEHRPMRAALSRNAGWQALFQNHLGTALKCFQRVVEDEDDASDGQQLESLVGSVLVLFRLGRLGGARALLAAVQERAAQAADARWVGVANLLTRDLVDQYRLRSCSQLADHIYWHSATLEAQSIAFDEADPEVPDETPVAGVLSRHADYLNHLRALARGSASALTQVETHLRWSQSVGLAEYHREQRLEVALAALAGRLTHVAEAMLHVFADRMLPGAQHAHWYNELLYCQAKLRQQQGRLHDYAQLYARYALQSLRHVRADSAAVPTVAAERTQATSDDMSARLPGKYRRAYRYLIEHLGRPDLSVREVASHIGVTERALQAAFKANLGYTPSQLIRNRRMERIRRELMEDETQASSVLRVANRWGIQHRSTLLNGYRQLFKEAPSQTLAR